MDPLINDDWNLDPDDDGMNYSRKWRDDNGNHKWDSNESWTLTQYDFDGDGKIDPILENESFMNYEEYNTGVDIDADGIFENTTDPGEFFSVDVDPKTKEKLKALGLLLPDAYFVYFLTDSDKDGLPLWYEEVYHLNDNEPTGENGSGPADIQGVTGDPDGDGFNNTAEYRHAGVPFPTNPRDKNSFPSLSRSTGGRSTDESEAPAVQTPTGTFEPEAATAPMTASGGRRQEY